MARKLKPNWIVPARQLVLSQISDWRRIRQIRV
jgi:hypothetical protein